MANIINASATNGITQTADGSGILQLQGNGTTGLTVDSTGAYGQLKRGTEVATTSGTFVDFTGIPSWVKRITVMLNGVSTNGTSLVQIQIGSSSGGLETTGYISNTSIASTNFSSTTGFVLGGNVAADAKAGHVMLTNVSGTQWLSSHSFTTGSIGSVGGGTKSLSGTLDRIRLTANGTDLFDAGSVNILYEG